MLTIRVIKTFKDKNKVAGYLIQSIRNLDTMYVESARLKDNIMRNKVICTNMTLTSDGRLVPHKETSTANDNNIKAANNSSISTVNIEEELKKFETDDYQHRNGNMPRSGKPDTIQVCGTEIIADFKNTSEKAAIQWMKTFLHDKGFKYKEVTAYQSGDYENDWVTARTEVTGKR